MSESKLLDLDKLLEPQHVMLNGVTHTLKPVNARVFRRVSALHDLSMEEQLIGQYDVVAMLLPDLPREQVDDLHPTQVRFIMELASDPVNAAQKYLDARIEDRSPNGPGDESPMPSSPTTGSDTPATAVHTELVNRLTASSRSHSPSPSTVTR